MKIVKEIDAGFCLALEIKQVPPDEGEAELAKNGLWRAVQDGEGWMKPGHYRRACMTDDWMTLQEWKGI